MPLSKSENKRFEITRDPYFEDIEWEYCISGAVQMGEGEGGEKFFGGLEMGANTFFKVSHMGAGTFFEVVVFLNRQIPQNPAWLPGKFLRPNNG